jgi:Tol biopolymer transport system component
MHLAPGTQLGAYEIVSAIGAGGMGEVYRARDTRLGRIVAIKVLSPELATDSQFRERFDREARTISQLTHPNICTLHDVGEYDRTPFLVMEHLDGETLAERLTRIGPLAVEQALHHALEIARALEAAHRHGIVHRDLKPGNIVLTKSGVKLLDFGLAKIVQAGVLSNTVTAHAIPTVAAPLTDQGTIVGTFQYMAPEQIEGPETDARTDIFAFGLVLYEMVTGRRAFTGTSQATLLAAILKDEPTPVAQLQPATPPALDYLIRTCLAKDRDDRIQTAHDVVLQLKWIAQAAQAATLGDLAAAKVEPRIWRERLLWLLTVGSAVLVTLVSWRPAPPAADQRRVTRFEFSLPAGQTFSRVGRHVLTLSPDGSKLAYVADGQLYLRSMDQLEARPIPGANDPVEPVFSPDGQSVAYFVPVEDEGAWTLKKIAISGGTPVTLARVRSAPTGASWRSGSIVFGMNFGTVSGVLAVPESGGSPRNLVSVDGTKERAAHPHLLDDGRHVLFAAIPLDQFASEGQIVVQAIDGSERRVLVNGGTNPYLLPTGHLVYLHDGTLFGTAFDTNRWEVTGSPVPLVQGVVETNTTKAGQFAIAEAGTLAFRSGAAGDFDRSLVWVDRQGRAQPIAAPSRAYFYPRLSPDGTRIAVSSADEEADIWMLDLTKDTLTRLTFGPATDWYSSWTPDGLSVLFSSGPGGSPTPGIFRTFIDRPGAATAITKDSGGFPYSVTPDGQSLLYRTGPGQPVDLMLLALGGGGQSRPLLSDPRHSEANGEISPDGRFIAYDSNESGRSEIYVRPFPEVDRARWQISTDGGSHPLWARSPGELLFRTTSAPSRLVSVAVEAKDGFRHGKPQPLFDLTPYVTSGVGRQFDISSDGKRFLMLKETSGDSSSIIVVTNWFDEVRAKMRDAP